MKALKGLTQIAVLATALAITLALLLLASAAHSLSLQGNLGCVAGGGPGGSYLYPGGGGGGGGGVSQTAYIVTGPTGVTVGAGGTTSNTTNGNNGGNSNFGSVVATGGGAGGSDLFNPGPGASDGSNGGSGGGGSAATTTSIGGTGVSGQGNAGGGNGGFTSSPYPSGGGGGAGAVGQTAPNGTTAGSGGAGIAFSLAGLPTSPKVGGGGGGGTYFVGTPGSGQDGGGNGASGNSGGGIVTGTSGTAHTGGGGGQNNTGGSGEVIFAHLTSLAPDGTCTSCTISHSGGYTIYTFYATDLFVPGTPYTPTPTNTPQGTNTFTSTYTATPTFTITPTFTQTPTNSPTPFGSVTPAPHNANMPLPFMGWQATGGVPGQTSGSAMNLSDALISSGAYKAGYTVTIVDDSWALGSRTADGFMQANSAFPSILQLSNYVHANKQLLFMYFDMGLQGCASGSMGSDGHWFQDVQQAYNNGVDGIDLDDCNISTNAYISSVLMYNATQLLGNGKMVMNYWGNSHGDNPYTYTSPWSNSTWVAEAYPPLWANVISQFKAGMVAVNAWTAGPQYGFLNFGELVVGSGMTQAQDNAQFAMWCEEASCLFPFGPDPNTMSTATSNLLLNSEMIAVDQDPLTIGGQKIHDDGLGGWTFAKPLKGWGNWSILMVETTTAATNITFNYADLATFPNAAAYGIGYGGRMRDIINKKPLGFSSTSYTTNVAGTSAVMFTIHIGPTNDPDATVSRSFSWIPTWPTPEPNRANFVTR